VYASICFDISIHPKISLQENNTTVDPYILYGKSYKNIREDIALSICGSNFSELDAEIKV